MVAVAAFEAARGKEGDLIVPGFMSALFVYPANAL